MENHSRNGLGAGKWNDREGLVLMLMYVGGTGPNRLSFISINSELLPVDINYSSYTLQPLPSGLIVRSLMLLLLYYF